MAEDERNGVVWRMGCEAMNRREFMKMAAAVVEATTNYGDPELLAKISKGLGNPMSGVAVNDLSAEQKIAGRGW